MSNKRQRKAPALRFKGFTDDWEQHKLGELSIIQSGKTPSSHNLKNYYPSEIPWVRTGDLNNDLIISCEKYISKQGAKSLSFLPPNTVLIAMYGGFNQIGRTGLLTFSATINQALASILPNSITNSYFLLELLNKHKNDWRRIAASSRKDPNITKKDIENKNLFFTTKKEQKQIENTIFHLSKLISLQQRKLKELKQIKGSLLTKILAGKNSNQPILRFRNFKNNWKQYRLKDLYTYSNGKAHEQSQQLNGKYELINLNSISIDGSLKSSGKYVNKSKDILKKNDLVMVLSDIAHGLLLGRVAVIPKDNKYVLNQRIALLRPQKNDENSNFMASLINNNQSYFHRMGSGTSQLNISKSAVTESKWFIPEPDEQLAIGNLLKEIDNYIFLQQDKINQLTALRKFLSQNLFI